MSPNSRSIHPLQSQFPDPCSARSVGAITETAGARESRKALSLFLSADASEEGTAKSGPMDPVDIPGEERRSLRYLFVCLVARIPVPHGSVEQPISRQFSIADGTQ